LRQRFPQKWISFMLAFTAYEEWIEFIREYRKPNTHRFYRERFESDILPMISGIAGSRILNCLTSRK
ncbi:MAG TPA: hypothetical protein PLW17_10365, partial [Limnochordia bacterium]|nr:hypothetical protein [Limnochordia bacterium]